MKSKVPTDDIRDPDNFNDLPSLAKPMPFRIAALRVRAYRGKVYEEETWDLSFPIGGLIQNLPCQLLVSGSNGHYVAHIMAPRLSVDHINLTEGMQLTFTLDHRIAHAAINEVHHNLPGEPKQRAEAILDYLSKKQGKIDIFTMNGTLSDLKRLLQDVTNLIGRDMTVRAKVSPSAEYKILDVSPHSQETGNLVFDILNWFQPIGQVDATHGNLDKPNGPIIDRFKCEELSGHERLEAIERFETFFGMLREKNLVKPRSIAAYRRKLGITKP